MEMAARSRNLQCESKDKNADRRARETPAARCLPEPLEPAPSHT